MADRIVAMNEGTIQQVGTPQDLYDNPANTFVAGFIGSPAMNFVDGMATFGQAATELAIGTERFARLPAMRMPGSADPPRDGRVIVGLRPERIAIAETGAGAIVDLVEPTGLGSVVHLDLAGQPVKLFTTDRRPLAVGEHISLRVAAEDVLLFDRNTGLRLRAAG